MAKHQMVITFWGVRGTLPVPGKTSIRYGGNTNCITLQYDENNLFIFDAGTGIKALSDYLTLENKLPINAKLFLTHPHYDHISGLPYFAPFYSDGNKFEIIGIDQDSMPLNRIIEGQMNHVYFPISMREFPSTVIFHSIQEETFFIHDLCIKTFLLNHPGKCIGYRIEYQNRSFCYITDNEIYLENSPQYQQNYIDNLIAFIQGTNVLVIDSTYSDEEYLKKIGWGHSCISRVVDIADKAKVELLCLYHHDPDQTDDDIDAKLQFAQECLKSKHSLTKCIAPREGDKIQI